MDWSTIKNKISNCFLGLLLFFLYLKIKNHFMKNSALIVMFSALVCISCKNEEEIPVSNKPVIPFTQLGNQQVQQKNMQQPVQQTAQTTTTTTQQQAAPVQVAPGMNPSHGQPGHRCDIAVGAPLNSPKGVAPATAQKPVVTQSKVISAPAAPVAAPTGPIAPTPEGMNPPHGQEGHVCSVAVGAPLPK
jgi:hypothetical protein